jgi:hypothetical protein
LRKATLRLPALQRNSVHQQLVFGNSQQETALTAFRQSLLQFVPCNFKLGFGPLVIEPVKADILHQDVQAVNKRPRGRDSSTLGCIGGEDMLLLELRYGLRVMLNRVTTHITEVIRCPRLTERALP